MLCQIIILSKTIEKPADSDKISGFLKCFVKRISQILPCDMISIGS